ncbi:39S ribosomal protein L44, mitochondrial [Kluyveromyces marxianus]|nr:39S ribosomal protein L44, mitochondrial [Kluyveromyces marxianus]
MITKYFTKAVVKFNPFGKEGITSGLQLQNEVLMAGSTVKPTVKVVFKDKTELQADPTNMNFTELSNYFDRHSRKLALKESIESQ